RSRPTSTGNETIRIGSSPKSVTVSNTVSPSRRRASRAGAVGRRAEPSVALRATTWPSSSVIWTSLSSRTNEGGPGAISRTRTGVTGLAWSADCSVVASEMISSSTRPAHGLAGVLHQYLENRVLLRGEPDPRAATGHAASRRVERQIGHAEHGRPGEASPAEQRPDPCEELGEGERLREVVVGSRAQAADPIGETIPRGEHEDRSGEIARSERLAHRDAVLARQEQANKDKVVFV